MLNISKNKIENPESFHKFKSYQMTLPIRGNYKKIKTLLYVFLFILIFTFLPWTQTIRSPGYVTALRPDHRPQTIQSVIAGRIESWYVAEGDYVMKGDTIIQISEIRDNFFDPLLLERTRMQADAQRFAAESFGARVKSQQDQVEALKANNILRKEQARNRLRMAELKVQSDSIRFEQAKVNFEVGQEQLRRAEKLFEEGLRSLVDLETRKLSFQDVQANIIAAENNLLSSQNELLAAQIEIQAVDNDFRNQVSSSEADMYSAMSSQFGAEANAHQLENQFSNYSVRSGYRFILAPQDGYITRAIQTGVGENIQEGAEIISILPGDAKLAVEMFVEPVDLPLIRPGNKVRFIFDGWPAIVFSGWPQLSNGTFGGMVTAVDNFAGPNNRYRVLVVEDPDEDPWPGALRIGSGADGIALLNDVPIWYEIWRQMNGFPADYYSRSERQLSRNQ